MLVEARARVFYSGDLRAHGWSRAFTHLVKDPPKGVDALLLEGTWIGPGQAREPLSEGDVEQLATAAFARARRRTRAVLPQNVDRLVTVFRAARPARRALVLDLYAASVSMATGRSTIPHPGFEGIKIYVPSVSAS